MDKKTAAQQSRTTRAEGTDRARQCLKYLAVPNYYMTHEREILWIYREVQKNDMFLLKYIAVYQQVLSFLQEHLYYWGGAYVLLFIQCL